MASWRRLSGFVGNSCAVQLRPRTLLGSEGMRRVRCSLGMMGRTQNYKNEPWAVCDHCGRMTWSSHDRGLVCWFCERGVFMNAMHWHIVACPECHGEGRSACAFCGLNGYLAIPREDLNWARLKEDWQWPVRRNEGAIGNKASLIAASIRVAETYALTLK
jgi:hypothetical protein